MASFASVGLSVVAVRFRLPIAFPLRFSVMFTLILPFVFPFLFQITVCVCLVLSAADIVSYFPVCPLIFPLPLRFVIRHQYAVLVDVFVTVERVAYTPRTDDLYDLYELYDMFPLQFVI